MTVTTEPLNLCFLAVLFIDFNIILDKLIAKLAKGSRKHDGGQEPGSDRKMKSGDLTGAQVLLMDGGKSDAVSERFSGQLLQSG